MMKIPRIRELIDGILLLDKPTGITSNAALQTARNLVGAKKAGHTGSLDPLATGMLPLCFGTATRFGHYLLEADKQYVATARLGIKTDTADSTGTVIASVPVVNVTRESLEAVLMRFTGSLMQVPSMFSALKHAGQPLYQLARAGITVERDARPITIHALTLDAFDHDTFTVTVRCSKGTYIRNLVEDIGDMLGIGAHVTALRRTWVGGLEHDSMVSLEALSDMTREERLGALLPSDRAVAQFPAWHASFTEMDRLRKGQSVMPALLYSPGGLMRVYDPEGHFEGLAEVREGGLLHAKRLSPTGS